MLKERQYRGGVRGEKTKNQNNKPNQPKQKKTKTKKSNQNKKANPPITIFNSKVRCGSSLLNFLKQNNIISASTISKVPNNAFYSIILYLKKAFDLNKTPKFYILVPPKEHNK